MSMWSLPPLAIDLLAQLRLSIGVYDPGFIRSRTALRGLIAISRKPRNLIVDFIFIFSPLKPHLQPRSPLCSKNLSRNDEQIFVSSKPYKTIIISD